MYTNYSWLLVPTCRRSNWVEFGRGHPRGSAILTQITYRETRKLELRTLCLKKIALLPWWRLIDIDLLRSISSVKWNILPSSLWNSMHIQNGRSLINHLTCNWTVLHWHNCHRDFALTSRFLSYHRIPQWIIMKNWCGTISSLAASRLRAVINLWE